jgi:heme/copper-type cytochrome/quinol oxidase subunit 3
VSGYSAAKWGTESSIALAKAASTRAKANRAFEESITFRAADTASFNAWFTAYIAGDQQADRLRSEGTEEAETSDEYVRTTVILASVLFLVGISTQFHVRAVRYGLIAVGTGLLIFGGVLIPADTPVITRGRCPRRS